jgi:DNA-directed RNA polymerase subunit M/transcription elongation factor TFIIS
MVNKINKVLSDEFFCNRCQFHLPVSAKTSKKSLHCSACEKRINESKNNKVDAASGSASRLTLETRQRKARIDNIRYKLELERDELSYAVGG